MTKWSVNKSAYFLLMSLTWHQAGREVSHMEPLTRKSLKKHNGMAKGIRKIHLVVFSGVEEP